MGLVAIGLWTPFVLATSLAGRSSDQQIDDPKKECKTAWNVFIKSKRNDLFGKQQLTRFVVTQYSFVVLCKLITDLLNCRILHDRKHHYTIDEETQKKVVKEGV